MTFWNKLLPCSCVCYPSKHIFMLSSNHCRPCAYWWFHSPKRDFVSRSWWCALNAHLSPPLPLFVNAGSAFVQYPNLSFTKAMHYNYVKWEARFHEGGLILIHWLSLILILKSAEWVDHASARVKGSQTQLQVLQISLKFLMQVASDIRKITVKV